MDQFTSKNYWVNCKGSAITKETFSELKKIKPKQGGVLVTRKAARNAQGLKTWYMTGEGETKQLLHYPWFCRRKRDHGFEIQEN